MSKNELREKVETEEDFINAKGYKNSLTRFKTYYKSKVPEKQIAYMLASTVEEIEETYQNIIKKARQALKIDID
jgi:ribosome-binding protein aMBF1 (putative translation factor)